MSATARMSHEAETSAQDSTARRGGVALGASHRPSRYCMRRGLAATKGSAITTAAARIPPMPTTAKPSRTAAEFPGQAAAVKPRGASAALSIKPRVTSERQIERIPAGQPGKRRTIAIRISSSNRPGRTMPHDRRASAGGRESHRPRPLARGEKPAPAARLDEERDEEEERDCDEQRRLALREGHRRIAHVHGRERNEQKADRSRADTRRPGARASMT